MALVLIWTTEQIQEWDEWLKDRPQIIKDMATKLPPNKLYRNKITGQIGVLVSYAENGTVRASFPNDLNFQMSTPGGRQVFGLLPDDLEECEYPEAEKIVGPSASGLICTFCETEFYKESKRLGLIKD